MFKNKKIIISILLTLFPIIFVIFFYNKLPQLIPTRFSFDGTILSYQNKIFLFFVPIIFTAINIFTITVIKNDPKNIEVPNSIINIYLILIPIFSNFIIIASILFTLKYIDNFTSLLLILVAILLIVLGNYLPKCRSSYTIGIRTPWTLNDEENWRKTHKFAGKIFIIVGILFLISILFKFKYSYIFLFLLTLPPIYSFIIRKK